LFCQPEAVCVIKHLLPNYSYNLIKECDFFDLFLKIIKGLNLIAYYNEQLTPIVTHTVIFCLFSLGSKIYIFFVPFISYVERQLFE
jgi:hypothetical protein